MPAPHEPGLEDPTMGMDSQIARIARIARDHLDDLLRSLAPEAEPAPSMVSGGPHGVGGGTVPCSKRIPPRPAIAKESML